MQSREGSDHNPPVSAGDFGGSFEFALKHLSPDPIYAQMTKLQEPRKQGELRLKVIEPKINNRIPPMA